MTPKEFQSLLGVTPDGVWGTKTLNATKKWFTKGGSLETFLSPLLTGPTPSKVWYMVPAMVELLGLIRKHEGGVRGYNADYRNDDKWTLTDKTFDQVRALGRSQVVQGEASSAIGGYQFLTKTLDWLKDDLRLSGTEIMTPAFQDDLAIALMTRKRASRGFMKFVRGEIGVSEFGLGLAQEWASLPVLADVRGAHRSVSRGQSYYAGDGLNKALVSAEEVERVLKKLQSEASAAYAREHSPSRTIVVAPEEDIKPASKGVGLADFLWKGE